MRSLLRILPFVALSVIACEPAETTPEAAEPAAEMAAEDETAVRNAMEAQLDTYEQAALAGEIPGMLAIWTDDVELYEPGLRMSGSDLPGFYEEMFATGGITVNEIDIRTSEVFVHDDVAYSIGDYEEDLTVGADAETMTVHNHYFARWERGADGTWKVDRIVVGAVDGPEEMEQPEQ